MDREKIEKRYKHLKCDAQAGGYILNGDESFVRNLVEGLLKNKERYGIEACPCRLYVGTQEENLDAVCPCIYRDDDLAEYGACFCALYVTQENAYGLPDHQIPERRPPYAKRKKQALQKAKISAQPTAGTLPYPIWRCSVCGYLCARTQSPEVCPICKAKKDRFELFMQ